MQGRIGEEEVKSDVEADREVEVKFNVEADQGNGAVAKL